MTRRGWGLMIVLVLLALALAYRLNRLQQRSPSFAPVERQTGRSPEASLLLPTGSPRRVGMSGPIPSQAGDPLDKSARLALAADAKNVSVNFWGKVVDPDGAPVAGVKVRARIRHWQLEERFNVGTRFIKKEAVSGGDGQFEISGATGDVLTFEALEKEAYEPEPTALRSFGYNISTNLQPDPKKPIEMRLWPTGSRDRVITGDQFFGIIPDGRVYTIDLLKGTHVESASAEGDLRLWVKRPLDVLFGQRYDWSFHIAPVNGGVTEVWDEVYLAPADGYSDEYAYSRKTTDSAWGDMSRKQFVLRTRAGQVYGRARLHIFAAYDLAAPVGAIDIQSAVNPAGSRKLF